MMRRGLIAAVCAVLLLAAPAAGQIVGACHVSPVVADLERARRFYGDLLGLDATAPTSGPEANARSFVARIPGAACGIEAVAFASGDRTPRRWRMQDAGAVTLILLVRDIDAAFAPLRAAGVDVVTTGGAPVRPSPRSQTRAVIVRDPDGHFVELAQLEPPPSIPQERSGNVYDLRFRVTVADFAQSIAYYERLGIVAKAGAFSVEPGVMAMMGLPEKVEYRVTMTPIPGSTLIFELLDLRGLERGAVRVGAGDAGAYRLRLKTKGVAPAVAPRDPDGIVLLLEPESRP